MVYYSIETNFTDTYCLWALRRYVLPFSAVEERAFAWSHACSIHLTTLLRQVTRFGTESSWIRGSKIADNIEVSRRECIFPISLLAFWKLQCIYRRYIYKLLFRGCGKEGGRCQSRRVLPVIWSFGPLCTVFHRPPVPFVNLGPRTTGCGFGEQEEFTE